MSLLKDLFLAICKCLAGLLFEAVLEDTIVVATICVDWPQQSVDLDVQTKKILKKWHAIYRGSSSYSMGHLWEIQKQTRPQLGFV